MPVINVLSKNVADLIAAGEVVERPSSVVKELVENSIDAGATNITVEIKNGGIKYIRITDNGCGISRQDIRNAFVSHATSKIIDANDLNSIMTLGFRGEALASVSAVATVEILTRTADENVGTSYQMAGGEEILLDDAGCPVGTTLVVRDLFFNTPARMKFLKKDVSEANSVAGVVDRLALSHPEISFRFIREGKETLLTPGDDKLDSTIYAVFGKEFSDTLLAVNYELDGVKITGFISKPTLARPNRSMQFFFINGRLIKTGTGSAALSEAYKNSIMAGKFPACVLNIDMLPQNVDVNVHPAKIEVRFANEKAIFNAIYYATKNAITGTYSRPHADLKKSAVKQYFNAIEKAVQTKLSEPKQDFWSKQTAAEYVAAPSKKYPQKAGSTADEFKSNVAEFKSTAPESKSNELRHEGKELESAKQVSDPGNRMLESEQNILRDSSKIHSEVSESDRLTIKKFVEQSSVFENAEEAFIKENQKNAQTLADNEETDEFKNQNDDVIVIGEAFKTYILAQLGETILIIDKHAAHERIIFEQLRKKRSGNSSQIMLSPVTVTLSKEEYSCVIDNLEALREVGYEVEDFGAGMVIVQECPMMLDKEDIAHIIMELAGHLLENRQEIMPEKLDWIYHSTACRAAIKAGDFTSQYEMKIFVKNLLNMPDIRYCPHGRPVMIEMTRKEMEKSFGRV